MTLFVLMGVAVVILSQMRTAHHDWARDWDEYETQMARYKGFSENF
jgi:hypothetical protein